MSSTQITLPELLTDSVFRQWFHKVPKYPDPRTSPPKRWHVWAEIVTPEGKTNWRLFERSSYREAHSVIAELIKKDSILDLTLGNPTLDHPPPLVKRKDGSLTLWTPSPARYPDIDDLDLAAHRWCGLCRRPTLFMWFRRHHAMPANLPINADRRCRVCGARAVFVIDWSKRFRANLYFPNLPDSTPPASPRTRSRAKLRRRSN